MRALCALCKREFLVTRASQRFCSRECRTTYHNKRFTYKERRRASERRGAKKRRCQYLDPETDKRCNRKTNRYFLCDYHFSLGEQVEDYGIIVNGRDDL